MEWNKELEEIGENLFAEYDLDRDPLKEAYMAGVKAAMSELLDEVNIKFEFGPDANDADGRDIPDIEDYIE